jgi:hypothetical protein
MPSCGLPPTKAGFYDKLLKKIFFAAGGLN